LEESHINTPTTSTTEPTQVITGIKGMEEETGAITGVEAEVESDNTTLEDQTNADPQSTYF